MWRLQRHTTNHYPNNNQSHTQQQPTNQQSTTNQHQHQPHQTARLPPARPLGAPRPRRPRPQDPRRARGARQRLPVGGTPESWAGMDEMRWMVLDESGDWRRTWGARENGMRAAGDGGTDLTTGTASQHNTTKAQTQIQTQQQTQNTHSPPPLLHSAAHTNPIHCTHNQNTHNPLHHDYHTQNTTTTNQPNKQTAT